VLFSGFVVGLLKENYMGWKFRMCEPGKYMCEGILDDEKEVRNLAGEKDTSKSFILNEALAIGLDVLTKRRFLEDDDNDVA